MNTPRRQMQYEPKRLVGQNIETLRDELQGELDRMANVLETLTDFSYLPQGAEPKRFQDGSVRFFIAGLAVTGVPVTEKGLYQFRDGAWRKLAEV